MCYLSTSFDKENGTSKAGSHKRKKKHDKNSIELFLLTLVLNTYQQHFLYLKVAKKWYKKFIMQR